MSKKTFKIILSFLTLIVLSMLFKYGYNTYITFKMVSDIEQRYLFDSQEFTSFEKNNLFQLKNINMFTETSGYQVSTITGDVTTLFGEDILDRDAIISFIKEEGLNVKIGSVTCIEPKKYKIYDFNSKSELNLILEDDNTVNYAK